MKKLLFLIPAVCCVFCHPVGAQIRVVKTASEKTAMDFSGFTVDQAQASVAFRRTLERDLVRWGWFQRSARGGGEVRLLGSATGRGGNLRVEFSVYGTATKRNFIGKTYRVAAGQARTLAHKVADEIVSAVLNRTGVASTRILMVGTGTRHKELYLCDADGENLVQLTRDRSVSVRPRWSPDGESAVYTSYIRRFPDIYRITLATGVRKALSNEPGLNTGGAISPDGKDMALILSKDGNPELYVKNLRTGRLTRITRTGRAAEASPSWSPDGRRIVYVSDQSGRPHLYVVSRDGGRPSRLTSRGSENVAPDWGPGGMIAYTSRVGGRYQVFVIDPETRQAKGVSPGDADYEDPSWAPNGRHIVSSRSVRYQSSLYILDTLGDPPIALLERRKGDWFSPAWSPL